MRRIQMLGMLLWRGGLLLLGVAAAIEVMRTLMRFMDVPGQVEVGGALFAAGLVLVIVSLIMERVRDSRNEAYLRE